MHRNAYLVLFLLLWTPMGQTAVAPPNIVLLFGDDLGRYASIYRDSSRATPNDVVQTPNIDKIAREGTTFWNAFVSAPSCTPSRAALVSGRHFFRNGSHSQLHSPWKKGAPDPWDQVKGFPLLLQDHGYHIGWSYKMHISEDRMGGATRNYRKAGSRFNNFSEHMSAAKDPLEEKAALLNEVRKNCSAFLEDRKKDQPFFYWFNPTNTHRTWVKGSGKKLWGINPDNLKGKLPKFLPDEPEIREDIADYLGEVQAFDSAVGVITEELRTRGLLDNTLLVVSGDNGIPGFTRGKTTLYDFGTQVPLIMRFPSRVGSGITVQEPVSLVDLAPTFLYLADIYATPDMNGQDLIPLTSGKIRHQPSAGRGFAISGREVHFSTAREGNLPYPARSLRTSEFLYIRNFKPDRNPMGDPGVLDGPTLPSDRDLEFVTGLGYADMDAGPFKSWIIKHKSDQKYSLLTTLALGKNPPEELYHIPTDPDQMHNLSEKPTFQKKRIELRHKLEVELKINGDPRLSDEFDRPPYLRPPNPAKEQPSGNNRSRKQ